MLSAVVSKTAIYGFLRIGIPKFPEPADDLSGLILVLASAGLVYGSVLAFRSADLRGVIAYSSMAQMGLITIGVFAFDDLGIDGAILQSVAHGLISAAMFLLVGMVERRCGTGELDALGGMARGRPTARDDRARRGDDRARGPRLGDVRRRVPDHGRASTARAGATRSSSRSASCSRRCTRSA